MDELFDYNLFCVVFFMGYDNMVLLLLLKEIDINMYSKIELSFFYVVCVKGNYSIVKFFFE